MKTTAAFKTARIAVLGLLVCGTVRAQSPEAVADYEETNDVFVRLISHGDDGSCELVDDVKGDAGCEVFQKSCEDDCSGCDMCGPRHSWLAGVEATFLFPPQIRSPALPSSFRALALPPPRLSPLARPTWTT